jgi:hypothetical protein
MVEKPVKILNSVGSEGFGRDGGQWESGFELTCFPSAEMAQVRGFD